MFLGRGWGGPPAPIHLASLLGRYPLAVTKYRESELYSSSLYNQNDPWDPPVVFEEFLRNNENIEDEVRAPSPSRPSPRPDVGPVPGSVPTGSLLCGLPVQGSPDLFIP